MAARYKVEGLGRAAVCDCGTPWTFLLPFFFHSAPNVHVEAIHLKFFLSNFEV